MGRPPKPRPLTAKLAGKANFGEYGAASRGLPDRDPDRSMCRRIAAMVIAGKYWSIVVTLCGASVAALAAQQALTEAPTGFDTPTLVENPGSRSVSNGIAEPAGDSFALDQQIYELTHDVDSGLGPVFNARACADCHQNPVSGGATQFTELRVGHTDATGNFVNPTIPIDDGASSISGRSLVNDRAVVPEAQEHAPDTQNLRALRAALNTLGDGFVEAIDDNTLLAHRRPASAYGPRQDSRRGHRGPCSGGPWKKSHRPLRLEGPAQLSPFLHWRCLSERDGHHQPLEAGGRDDDRQSDGGRRGCAGQFRSRGYRPLCAV